jgi:hypothetical protein
MQFGCHSLAAVLTPVQTKQITINIHKRNNTKTVQTVQNRVNTGTDIAETHTLQTKLKQPQYSTMYSPSFAE